MGLFKSYPVVVYTSFPKSGSQSIRSLILEVLGNKSVMYVPKSHVGFGHNVISFFKLPFIKRYFRPSLIYGHIPPTRFNVHLLDKIRTTSYLVSVRKLEDVVVSYKDHIDRESAQGWGPLDYRIPNTKEVVSDWQSLSNQQKYDFIIKFIMPWYIRFAAGWFEWSKNKEVKFIWFDEAISKPSELVEIIATIIWGAFDDVKYGKVELQKVNFNKGLMGRGRSELSEKNIQDIRALMKFFPDLENSELGTYLLSPIEPS